VATPAEIDAALADLGHQLADRRKAAGLTQGQLAARTPFKRSTVANAETGARRSARFWQAMDRELAADGVFIKAHAAIEAMTGTRHLPPLPPGEEAGPMLTVTSLGRCPHCHREIGQVAHIGLTVVPLNVPGSGHPGNK
jgi:hypothetical protein